MSDKGGPIQSRDDNPTRKKPLETLEEVFLKLEAKVSGRKLSAAFVESSLSKEFAASLRSSRCPFPSAHSCYETRVVVRKSNGERSRRVRSWKKTSSGLRLLDRAGARSFGRADFGNRRTVAPLFLLSFVE